MEKIVKFLRVTSNSGTGSSSGYGSGSGTGSGDGSGDGSGYGSGYGTGSSSGSGSGYGSGSGDGSGDGSGYGYGYGYGSGSGDGSGYGIYSFNKQRVHIIDGIQTLLYHVRENIAKGAILNSDLTFTGCYIVRDEEHFAHGSTLAEAMEALSDKQFEDMPLEDRIDEFMLSHEDIDSVHSNQSFFSWHNKLTGSCLLGRESFAKDKGVNLSDSMTVREFIELTENAYNGEIIKEIKQKYCLL